MREKIEQIISDNMHTETITVGDMDSPIPVDIMYIDLTTAAKQILSVLREGKAPLLSEEIRERIRDIVRRNNIYCVNDYGIIKKLDDIPESNLKEINYQVRDIVDILTSHEAQEIGKLKEEYNEIFSNQQVIIQNLKNEISLAKINRDKDWLKYLMRRGIMITIPPQDYDPESDVQAENIVDKEKREVAREIIDAYENEDWVYVESLKKKWEEA